MVIYIQLTLNKNLPDKWYFKLESFLYPILMALEVANSQLQVPSLRNGDFQGEHRDFSP